MTGRHVNSMAWKRSSVRSRPGPPSFHHACKSRAPALPGRSSVRSRPGPPKSPQTKISLKTESRGPLDVTDGPARKSALCSSRTSVILTNLGRHCFARTTKLRQGGLQVLPRVGLWRSWERASMAWKRSSVRSRPGPPSIPSLQSRRPSVGFARSARRPSDQFGKAWFVEDNKIAPRRRRGWSMVVTDSAGGIYALPETESLPRSQ